MNNILNKIKLFDDDIDLTVSKNEVIIDMNTDNVINDLFDSFNDINNKIENINKLVSELKDIYSEFFSIALKNKKQTIKK